MLKSRMGLGLFAAWLVLGANALTAWAAPPTVAQMLSFRPKQTGVPYYVPTPEEESACRVEPDKKTAKNNGWVLIGPQGQTLRRFLDANGDNKIDIWSYYNRQGIEVYRELDTKFTGKPDMYRWLNAGGMKVGIDPTGDGKIKFWKVISPEEVGQEILQSLITRDFARLRALMISEAEMKELGLPEAQKARIRDLQAKAASKFQDTIAKLPNLSPATHDPAAGKPATTHGTQWLHIELSPACEPAEQNGMRHDLLKYSRGTILCETNGKSDWIQTGEMIQVGMAWRIIDAPIAGPEIPDAIVDRPGHIVSPHQPPEVQKLLAMLEEHDKTAPRTFDPSTPCPDVVRYQLRRADILEQIIAKVKPEEREPWIRQVADCLSAAAQSSPDNDKTAYQRLQRLEDLIAKAMPGSNLAASIGYRRITADFSERLKKSINPEAVAKVQHDWVEQLTRFVQTYPKAEETADALLQAGMISEMLMKDSEAKKLYQLLVQNAPNKPQAAKARGAVKRLEIEGKPMELAAPILGTGSPFDIAKLQGKVVIVYYWASWNQQCVGDFAKLKYLLDTHGSKGLELVCVNLDSKAEEAVSFLRKTPAPGVHIHMATTADSTDSPLATQYGIFVLPNTFLVGKDGKVVSRTTQVSNLEMEVAKLLR